MNCKTIASALSILAVICGGVFFMHTHFATNDAVASVQQNLNEYKLEQAYEKALEELFFWRKQARAYPEDEDVQRHLLEAEARVEYLKKQLELRKAD